MHTQTTPPDKPGAAPVGQNPAAVPVKPSDAPGKEAPPAVKPQDKQGASQLIENNGFPQDKKDGPPPADVAQPVLPLQPPPGALIPVPPKEQPKKFEIGTILWPSLLLIGMLAIGAILIAWLKKNKDRQLAGEQLSANDQLTAFRDSLDQGDMTDDEFKKVKALLSEKIRHPQQTAPPVQAPAPPAAGQAGLDHRTKP